MVEQPSSEAGRPVFFPVKEHKLCNDEQTLVVGFLSHEWKLSSRAAGCADQGLSVPCFLRLLVHPASEASSKH